MGREAERSWAFVLRSPARYYETLSPAGFRELCAQGLLKELTEPDASRYRFELTGEGYIKAHGLKAEGLETAKK